MNIRSANSADFPELLAIQVASIKSLAQTYQPEEIQAWVDYIETESQNRYAALKSAIIEDEANAKAFVSWSVKDQIGKIDCLFVLPELQVSTLDRDCSHTRKKTSLLRKSTSEPH